MLAAAIEDLSAALLKANRLDVTKQEAGNPKIDRLLLNEQRLKSIAKAISTISR